MCKKLDHELKRGTAACKALVKHHHAMGGVKMTAPVAHKGARYLVTCKRLGKTPRK